MKPDKSPEVVDLHRYKAEQAAKVKEKARLESKAKASRPRQGAGGPESFLGGRPKAGLILALIAAAAAGLFVVPRLIG